MLLVVGNVERVFTIGLQIGLLREKRLEIMRTDEGLSKEISERERRSIEGVDHIGARKSHLRQEAFNRWGDLPFRWTG